MPIEQSAEWRHKDCRDVPGTIEGRSVRGRLTLVEGEPCRDREPPWCKG